MVSAFQVGVSSAKKRSYSVGDRGLPGVEVEAESWAGAGARGRSSTAGRGQTTMDPSPHPPAGNTHPESGACTRGLGVWPSSWGECAWGWGGWGGRRWGEAGGAPGEGGLETVESSRDRGALTPQE